MSVIIGFYGESNRGKTMVIEKIIEELTGRGYKVAAVKITDKSISLDKEGKDTWRYSESGSKIVSLVSPIETSLLFKYPLGITTLMRYIKDFIHVDVILVEGANHSSIPKIRFGVTPIRENTVLTYNGDTGEILGLILEKLEEEKTLSNSITVKVNGEEVPLSEFPSEFIKQTIIGMLKSLKGVDEIHEVDIHFTVEHQ